MLEKKSEKSYSQLYYLGLMLMIVAGVLFFRHQTHSLLSSLKWENLAVHSTIETIGGLFVLLMAIILLQKKRWK